MARGLSRLGTKQLSLSTLQFPRGSRHKVGDHARTGGKGEHQSTGAKVESVGGEGVETCDGYRVEEQERVADNRGHCQAPGSFGSDHHATDREVDEIEETEGIARPAAEIEHGRQCQQVEQHQCEGDAMEQRRFIGRMEFARRASDRRRPRRFAKSPPNRWRIFPREPGCAARFRRSHW